MNKVMMTGNVVHTPEVRSTTSGATVCNFRIAVSRRFKDQSGNRQTDFFDVTAWHQLGDLCGRFLQKGRKVLVVGEMQTRQYEARDGGGKRTAYTIVADEVEFLTPNNNVDDEPQEGAAKPKEKAPSLADAAAEAGFTVVEDDELPF